MHASSLFSCLNSLATIDEFYSKSHVIYGVLLSLSNREPFDNHFNVSPGIEPVIAGLSSTLRLRNYSATQLGSVDHIMHMIEDPAPSKS